MIIIPGRSFRTSPRRFVTGSHPPNDPMTHGVGRHGAPCRFKCFRPTLGITSRPFGGIIFNISTDDKQISFIPDDPQPIIPLPNQLTGRASQFIDSLGHSGFERSHDRGNRSGNRAAESLYCPNHPWSHSSPTILPKLLEIILPSDIRPKRCMRRCVTIVIKYAPARV